MHIYIYIYHIYIYIYICMCMCVYIYIYIYEGADDHLGRGLMGSALKGYRCRGNEL